MVSYKTTTGATATISRQLFKIAYFADLKSSKLTVDTDATMGGKQDPNKQSRMMILVYKTAMHSESQLNSAPCGPKADPMTKQNSLIGTLRHLDQYLPTTSPPPCFTDDTEMEAAPQDYTEYGKGQASTPSHQQQPPP
jgi:hypothetical protein